MQGGQKETVNISCSNLEDSYSRPLQRALMRDIGVGEKYSLPD